MQFLRFGLVHLAVPIIGIGLYLWLRRQMRNSEIPDPPDISLFILFSAYGGWLIMLLTMAFWEFSGMAALGFIILVTIMPVIMLIMAIYLFFEREKSAYHYSAFIASTAYICLFIIIVIGVIGSR